MLKFIKGKSQQPSAEKQRLLKDLFAFRKTVQHGFPNKPTAIAWDPSLRLLIIGTASGAIKVFGKSGVEIYGQHKNENGDVHVKKIIVLLNKGRLITICNDNSLHLWDINENSVIESNSLSLEGKLKKISAACLESKGEYLLLGTEGGNIYLLNVTNFTMSDKIIYQDVVMQNISKDFKVNPGAVEAIAEQPGHPDHILIGYNRGLMVLWNKALPGTHQMFVSSYVSTQQIESVFWISRKKFVSSHNDGSYAYIEVGKDEQPSPNTPYGPFPCKAIPKILVYPKDDDYLILFSGGMQRSVHNDRHTVTVMRNGKDKKHVVFDFTSKVIDFFTIFPKKDKDSTDKKSAEPEALIVLVEEELVAIDLRDPNWKMIALPYLVSLHASVVTCLQYVSSVPKGFWDTIQTAGKHQVEHLYSDNPWPVDGGTLLGNEADELIKPKPRELLLTGHEDGTVRFWDSSDISLTPIYKFNSALLFEGDHLEPLEDEEEEEWPPFRKIGTFDPYSDDPRLAIKKVLLCPFTCTLMIAGTAGHVIIANLNDKTISKEVKVVTMNIMSDRDGFVWKGHDHLPARNNELSFDMGFQPSCILQLYPPASATAIALHTEWGLLSVGTAHGLAIFDYKNLKPIYVKCTLNPNDLGGYNDAAIARKKSFKKSLRESFRRLRKRRSMTRQTNTSNPTTPDQKKKDPAQTITTVEMKPVERQIEARSVDDSQGSMVRCLYFARSYIICIQGTTPTLWAGTNNGTVYVFTLGGIGRPEKSITCMLGKEIQLKHRAPVIGITILDGSNNPLSEPYETERGVDVKSDIPIPQRVLIASEEQFKIFNLPSLKPFCKYKLTAHEGSRVRKTGFAKFTCNYNNTERPEIYEEAYLLCLTNLGECLILSIPELKRELNAATIKKEDINGISSLTFTKAGEALYLHSSSEIQRISLSASRVTKTRCSLGLKIEATEAVSTENIQKLEGKKSEKHAKKDEAPVEKPKRLTKINETEVPNSTNAEDTNCKSPPLKACNSKTDVTVEVEDRQDTSSVGDITIDSVKDHLLNATSSEDLQSRLAGLNMEVTSRTSEISTKNNQLVVIKTTVITQQNANNGTTSSNPDSEEIQSNDETQLTNSTVIEREINSGTETTTTCATITLPQAVEVKK